MCHPCYSYFMLKKEKQFLELGLYSYFCCVCVIIFRMVGYHVYYFSLCFYHSFCWVLKQVKNGFNPSGKRYLFQTILIFA